MTQRTVAAFFDMDYTLLQYDTGPKLAIYLWQRGHIAWRDLIRTVGWAVQYKLSLLDLSKLISEVALQLRHRSEIDFRAEMQPFVEKYVLSGLFQKAKDCVISHRRAGHHVVLLTSSIQHLAEPLAHSLQMDEVCCTRIQVQEGRFTGVCETPICAGIGKVHYAQLYAKKHKIDLSKSFFYSDSFHDMPMFQQVGHPRVVNPDMRLWWEALKNNWPIEHW